MKIQEFIVGKIYRYSIKGIQYFLDNDNLGLVERKELARLEWVYKGIYTLSIDDSPLGDDKIGYIFYSRHDHYPCLFKQSELWVFEEID